MEGSAAFSGQLTPALRQHLHAGVCDDDSVSHGDIFRV